MAYIQKLRRASTVWASEIVRWWAPHDGLSSLVLSITDWAALSPSDTLIRSNQSITGTYDSTHFGIPVASSQECRWQKPRGHGAFPLHTCKSIVFFVHSLTDPDPLQASDGLRLTAAENLKAWLLVYGRHCLEKPHSPQRSRLGELEWVAGATQSKAVAPAVSRDPCEARPTTRCR